MTRLLIVSSGRADVGGLSSVWARAATQGYFDIHVLLTGRHVLRGPDYACAIEMLPSTVSTHVAGEDIDGRGALLASKGMGAILAATASTLAQVDPDVVLVLGDRLDMLPAAVACATFNIPLAHIHGGELTIGAIDDRVRHAVTKLSHLHFVSNPEAAQRLRRMGEEPWRIHLTGAPGLDDLSAQPEMSRQDFLAAFRLPDEPFLLVTVHPETNSASPLEPFEAVLNAIEYVDRPVLATAANADIGGAQINALLRAAANLNPRLSFCDTLGKRYFANALRHAALMLGNSSSGIVEAGLFGLPVVDVGRRQEGRTRGANVITVDAEITAIVRAIDTSLGRRFNPEEVSLYGDGQAAERILTALNQMPERMHLLRKVFADPPEADRG